MNWEHYIDSVEGIQELSLLDKKAEIIIVRYKSLIDYLKNLKCLFCKGTGNVMVCRECGRTTSGELASCRCDDNNMKGVGSMGDYEAGCGRCYGSGKDPRGKVKFN
jgi:RecJ-like exonuclease